MRDFPADTPDAELTAAIKVSDHAAFKTLYFRYFEALFRFLWRLTSDAELSKDCVQEVFSRIWNNREHLDPHQPIKSYLYRIGYNLVIDHRRQNKQRLDSLEAHPEIAPSYSADEPFELRDKIEDAIKNLPEPIRLVFTMNRFDGFKYAEIAAALDISVKTVEARMSKALKILREKLAPFLGSGLLLLLSQWEFFFSGRI
ncbi:MAG: RNA polymerase sigma-70 factor [candidate division KSB1 bacterium]|nr:RNA polymerase sigma-70 factor [candidate division KSB1 bacterium]MDZ7300589.1 RNA polymerase sigma-70 factor [candidate division KSB1 bacterium]MDZ7309726.1 RNA polymerase sigma-70 factor [candidate division KSB1 bacterium]